MQAECLHTALSTLMWFQAQPEWLSVCLQDMYVRNPALKSGLIFILRFGNTFWGGAQWVQYAKFIGIQ